MLDRVEQLLLRSRGQGGNGGHIGLRVGLHPRRGRADLRARLPCQQQLVLEADPVEPQQIAPQIDARMQVDIHRIAPERAEEETGGPDRERLTATLQGNSAGQGLRHQHQNIGKDVDGRDGLSERADRGGFILTAALAVDALQQLMLLDQRFDLRQRRRHRIVRGDRRTGHKPHHRPQSTDPRPPGSSASRELAV